MTTRKTRQKDTSLHSTLQVWRHIKAKYAETIVLVRKEDNYFTFGSDAEVVSIIMGIALEANAAATSVCSLPHYRTENLLQNIIKMGCSIALCDPLKLSS